jgi:hypothetical protein
MDKFNGKQLQTDTLFGRMLSVTVFPLENRNKFFHVTRTTGESQLRIQKEELSNRFYSFYDCFQNLLKKMLKNKTTKDKVLVWMRTLVNLNVEYIKMFPNQHISSSQGMLLNVLAIFLEL